MAAVVGIELYFYETSVLSDCLKKFVVSQLQDSELETDSIMINSHQQVETFP